MKPPSRYAEFAFVHALSVAKKTCEVGEPNSFSEVVSSQKYVEWLIAINEKMKSLHKNHTWVLVLPLNGHNVIGCKWVFKVKRKADGSLDKYKSRLVAKGFHQREG